MLTEVLLFVILINFMSQNIACAGELNDTGPTLTRHERDGLLDSFNHFFANIKNFFGLKSKQIEEKKQRVKTAFQLFFEELNRDKARAKPGNSENFMYNIDESRRPIPTLLESRHTSYFSRKVFDVKPETNADQLITAHGYRSESHTVLTADGYMLTMHRVLLEEERTNTRVVLMHHGLFGSAEDWLLLGPQRALPYLLTDNDYDVWLLNARGNRYSRIHTSKSKARKDFWDFSFHEMGVYDLPAVIKYITEITKPTEINYIGHSMGATALLVLLSTLPEYNLIMRSGILLAPLAFMFNAKGPISLLGEFYHRNGYNSLSFLGQTEFIPEGLFPEQIIERFCKGDEVSCANPLLLLANGGRTLSDENLMEDILSHVPAGGSVKTLLHYVQGVRTGFFQMFDYGVANNVIKYGNSTPPGYNLERVTTPIALFSSPSDWLSTVSDVQTLIPLLQDVNVHHIVKVEDFGHLDFVWSQDAPELVFNFILTTLDQILPKHADQFYQK